MECQRRRRQRAPAVSAVPNAMILLYFIGNDDALECCARALTLNPDAADYYA